MQILKFTPLGNSIWHSLFPTSCLTCILSTFFDTGNLCMSFSECPGTCLQTRVHLVFHCHRTEQGISVSYGCFTHFHFFDFSSHTHFLLFRVLKYVSSELPICRISSQNYILYGKLFLNFRCLLLSCSEQFNSGTQNSHAIFSISFQNILVRKTCVYSSCI